MKPPVVLTRPPERNGGLAEALEAAGIETLVWPGIQIVAVPPTDLEALAHAEIVAFVSPSAVEHGHSWLTVPGQKIVAQGPGTARELRRHGLTPDRIANPPVACGLAEAVASLAHPPARVAVLRGDRGRPDAIELLEEKGYDVTGLTVYANEPPRELSHPRRDLSAVVYASPSAAERLLDANPWLESVAAIAMGPTTAHYLRERGVTDVRLPTEPTEPELARVVRELVEKETE